MSEQLALAGVAAVRSAGSADRAAKPLTGNQQRALDFVRARDGVTAEQVGAYLHSTRDQRPHPINDPCQWCEKTGRQTAESKGLKPLVTYTNTGGERLYRARRREDHAPATPAPTVEPTEAELAANPFAGL